MTARKVNFLDLKAEYKEIRKDIDSAISRVLESGWYILGSEVANFEKTLADCIGVKYAVGVASGTDALTLALKSLDLKTSDAVLLPANVYPSVFGIALSGLKIKLCDVDPDTLNVNLETIKKAYSKDIKAMVVVHLYGNPVDIIPIRDFTKKKGIYLIEDCAQAAGSVYGGKRVGSFGDIACFSFYPTKNLGAYGDGGAILTNNEGLADKVRLWRMYGEKERYKSVLVGYNSRLDELQAAILSTKMRFLSKWNCQRHKIAEIYKEQLSGLSIKIIEENKKGKSNYHLFVIQTNHRDSLVNYLSKGGVQTGIHYPIPIHLTKAFSYLGYKKGDFPVSEKASREIISLPIYPQMRIENVKYVSDLIKKYFKDVR